MKKRTLRKRTWNISLVIAIAALVSMDFLMSPDGTETGTFRFESEFDVVTGATAKVGLVPSDYDSLPDPVSRTTDPTYQQVEDMVRLAIELQGGLDWVIDPGDKVLLKVNLVGRNSPSGEGENTDVRVVKALIRILHEFTQGDVTIQVAEGTARTNDNPAEAGSVWENSGYTELLSDPALDGIDFSLLNLNQSVEDMVEVDLGDKGTSAVQGTRYHVHRAQLEADKYIAVPVLKIHNTGITNALKLQVGSAPGCVYGYNKTAGTSYYKDGLIHDVDQRRWTTEMIVDLCYIADIDFVVVDAIMCLETYKSYRGDNQVRFNTVLAGADPVAVDHVATRLFCMNPDDIAHITLAEKVGLGTNDPDRIVIEGARVDDVRRKVKKNPDEEGKFGQSNRTWLLSPAFEGTSVEDNYIPGEEALRPLAGENGWSEAVYFFDDRIDLLSYYQGRSNMVSYAFTYFEAPADQTAELWLGTHEGTEVFLNGELVYSYYSTNSSFNDHELGGHVTDIQIRKGENALLVKTLQRFGDYSFTLNICEPKNTFLREGNRVDGLEFYTRSQATGLVPEARHGGEEEIRVYPNPATDQVFFKLAAAGSNEIEVRIYDIRGRLVVVLTEQGLPPTGRTIRWDLKDVTGTTVAPGTYIARVTCGGMTRSVQFHKGE